MDGRWEMTGVGGVSCCHRAEAVGGCAGSDARGVQRPNGGAFYFRRVESQDPSSDRARGSLDERRRSTGCACEPVRTMPSCVDAIEAEVRREIEPRVRKEIEVDTWSW